MKIPIALSLVLGCLWFSSGGSAAEPPAAAAGRDRPPIPTYDPAPKFPAELRKHALVAEVIVAFVVDHTGHVTKLRVTDAMVGRFGTNGTIPHYVYNANYALGRFIVVPPDGGKTSSPNPAHVLPEAPVVDVGSLRGAPTYLTSTQSDFGDETRKAIALWTYEPGQKDGHPVDTPLRVLVMFWRDARVSTATIE
jgi:hypothetical protein